MLLQGLAYMHMYMYILVLFSHLSESFLDHLLLSIPFRTAGALRMSSQVSMLDVKLRTHPQVVVNFLYVCTYVVTSNAANTTGWLI